jgi:hypothetical protein
MISTATLQRSIAVFGLLAGLCLGEAWLMKYLPRVMSGQTGAIVLAIGAFAILGVLTKLTAWERRRRLADDEAVQRVVEAARSQGVDVPEDRAIFPVFYRGRKPS